MPKPRRRRRFFALEGRFEVGDTGEMEGVVDPTQTDPAAFSPTGDEETPLDEAEAGQADVPEGVDPAAASTDESLPPAFRLNRQPRARAAQRRLFTRSSVLLSLACLGLGGLAGYLAARNGARPAIVETPGGAQKSGKTLTQADDNDLDAAYTARRTYRYEEAERLFVALERKYPEWGPIKVELGRTYFYENKAYEASAILKSAVEKNWKPAEANFLLGVLNKSRKSYSDAEACFARSVAIDPTEPEHYFFWGECLREEGKLMEATAKFRSALLRNQYETATGLYRSKLWLCAIEADQEESQGVNAQIDAALAEADPPMDAFVAAAARDLKAGKFAAAAANLSNARQRADGTVFRYIIGDPIFVPARSRPELAGFFQSAPPVDSQEAEATASSPPPSAAGSEPTPTVPPSPTASPVKGKKP